MKEPPIFGPNGAVLNSGTIPPEKIGQYDGSEPAHDLEAGKIRYTGVGKVLSLTAMVLQMLMFIPFLVSETQSIIRPKLAIVLIAASIILSHCAIPYLKDQSNALRAKAGLVIQIVLLGPFAYALLFAEVPLRDGLLAYLYAALFLQLVFGWIIRRFPSPRTPR